MGGLAFAVDWQGAAPAHDLETMLDLVPHRAAGGTTRATTDHSALGEARGRRDAAGDGRVVSVGHLSIVADLRLWSRDGLRSRAGGGSMTAGMGDRRLLLEAYRRTGIGFLDDVDGDFAFVIWDDEAGRVLAARDRFGVKPLFYELSTFGIRFASEPKQLACTAVEAVAPDDVLAAEHLIERFQDTRRTYFEGIQAVRPAMKLLATESSLAEGRYWNPSPETVEQYSGSDAAGEFRERLADSVRRRLETSDGVVSHLSGGLDSTSVAAAAGIVHALGAVSTPFHTVSAVFPGFSTDESRWISEIAATQSFTHHERAITIDAIDSYSDDMWVSDMPWIQRMREYWKFPIEVAERENADLLLTGSGGDDVLYQVYLLADLLRTGSLRSWATGVRAKATWSDTRIDSAAMGSLRLALPRRFKSAVRRRLPRAPRPRTSLIHADLWDFLQGADIDAFPYGREFPSLAQNAVVAFTQDPGLIRGNNLLESQHSVFDLGVSHPFLDRSLIEFIASLSPRDRPFDGRSKTLVRSGFVGYLPDSVLDRRVPTFFDEWFATVLAVQFPSYRDRFPSVPQVAERYIDRQRYAAAVKRLDAGTGDMATVNALWSAWTLMIWLDGLGRYEARR